MSRFLIVLALLFLLISPLFAQIGATPAATPIAVAPPATAGTPDAATAREDELFGRATLTWKQRRDLGLTFGNIAKAARQAHAKGDLEQGMSRSEIAAVILNELSAQNPKAYADAAIDLDAILQFIEAILPLIMTLINLWSWVAPHSIPMYACALVMPVFISRLRKVA